MDALSTGNQLPSGQTVSDRPPSGNIAPTSNAKAATPLDTSLAVTPAGKTQATREQVEAAVKDINKSLQSSSQGLEFSIDPDSKHVVVKLIDQQTKQVLRQIPNEEVLEISKSLDKLQGLLIKQSA
ncbi:flagellar protein FlaG [Undibacterium sp. RTI2.1]|uniref:flagellar protein FlaG n=1 Tax=unclassified Undibacterium TaxID=2630295 RepID=UPI002AB50828|nr:MULTISPECIES: flagellar protein FlaG [unclassified Undibacterium]MDY7537133.1 flagellar protein FlaG [Undibacterium sp. 5I1]MEB0029828.1 flagellar protein FlaG [Undibacterium sp. RTI2.1]MEB0115113.1 flagellar protein FlaG [Undibacterium sp. RTI2.2]MEB0229311.1 flagellar protein FlaG [Undibacterium sp. 10I3]MEB0256141.1 flagellar protein FlaG [Undibacterium sp. 5I1]